VKRAGHKLREAVDSPLPEWPTEQLEAELVQLEADPGDLNPWAALKRRGEIIAELERRFVAGNVGESND